MGAVVKRRANMIPPVEPQRPLPDLVPSPARVDGEIERRIGRCPNFHFAVNTVVEYGPLISWPGTDLDPGFQTPVGEGVSNEVGPKVDIAWLVRKRPPSPESPRDYRRSGGGPGMAGVARVIDGGSGRVIHVPQPDGGPVGVVLAG